MIKVSIIIPVYNIEKYLSICLDSVINQSYKNIEIILIDDGSTDNSGKICDDYSKLDKRIIAYHQDNSGVSFARNNGIKKATGEYITFIDSDDLIHPDYVKKLVSNLDNDTLSIGLIEKFQDNVVFSSNNDERLELDKNNLIELCKMSLFNTPCCKLYKASILKNNKVYFDTKLSLGEDLLFNLDYLKYVKKAVVAKQNLYYYRRGNLNTLSTIYYPNIMEIQLLLYDRYTDFFKNTKMDKESLITFDRYRFDIIKVIVANEFANGNVGFWKRCQNIKELLKSKEMCDRIKKIRYPDSKIDYFLISHRLVLIYKIFNKIK